VRGKEISPYIHCCSAQVLFQSIGHTKWGLRCYAILAEKWFITSQFQSQKGEKFHTFKTALSYSSNLKLTSLSRNQGNILQLGVHSEMDKLDTY